ncbi:transposable element Tcb2 transposase [Trichonephila clavipes]|nr:transposable element Tcb2 transposase [Trichonephila clavipes]
MWTGGEMKVAIAFSLTNAVFSVHPDSRRMFIWRDRVTWNNPALVHGNVGFSGGGMMIYAGISIDGCTDLHIILNGALAGRRYRDEILRPIANPYVGDFRLMNDDRAYLVDDFLFEEEIPRIDYPACLQDMN